MTTEIVTAISTLGFPIVACVGMFIFTKKMVDNYDKRDSNMQNQMLNALQENTKAMTELSGKIEQLGRGNN